MSLIVHYCLNDPGGIFHKTDGKHNGLLVTEKVVNKEMLSPPFMAEQQKKGTKI